MAAKLSKLEISGRIPVLPIELGCLGFSSLSEETDKVVVLGEGKNEYRLS